MHLHHSDTGEIIQCHYQKLRVHNNA
jgi:hypothetical protein